MSHGTLTRGAPMPAADRRWRVIVLSALALIFATLIALGVIQYTTTIGNRGVGQGNRKVDCVILDRIDPATQLAECQAIALSQQPKR